MILFELRCRAGHQFEGWFRDGGTFEAQAAAGEIGCPVCGDTEVAKALMAPRIGKGKAADVAHAKAVAMAAETRTKLAELRKHVEENFDYVGPRFAEEAKAIHYGETKVRDIYGEATDREAEELNEEGIKVGRIPWLPRPT